MTPEAQERFVALLEEHKRILYKVCHSYCRNRDDRDDLAQEIVLQLWRSFGTFQERCKFSTWMYQIALNVAISFYRRETTRTKRVVVDSERILFAIEAPEALSEEVLLLYQFIEKLEPLNKALILLYLDGYTYQEIADVLGVRETNVGTKIARLKQTMKQAFTEQERVS